MCQATCNQRILTCPPPTNPHPETRFAPVAPRLRKAGLRPVQIWVPDVRSKAFARAARRQSLAVAKSARAKRDQAFVDAISAWNEE